MRAITGEKFFTASFAAFAVYVLWQSFQYGVFSDSITGAGFFPALSGLLILISTGVALFAKTNEETAEDPSLDKEGSQAAGDKLEVFRVAALVALTAVFIFAAPYLGMIALTPIYILACFLILTPDRSAKGMSIGVATATGFTVVAWAVFDKALGVPMPRGLF